MDRRLKVLHFSPFPLNNSGANISMLTMLDEMRKNVDVQLCSICPGALSEAAEAMGIKTVCAFDRFPKSRLLRASGTILSLIKEVRKGRFDLLHCCSSIGNHYCKYVKLLTGIPLVTHQRDEYRKNYFNSALGSADHVIAITRFVRNTLPAKLQERTSVVLNPIREPAEKSPKPFPDIPLIGMIGRCNPGKGQDLFLKALAPLTKTGKVKILLWGWVDNEFSLTLKEMISQADLPAGSIEIVKYCNDVSAFYQQADIVVVPSRVREGMGRVQLEAMSYLRPVIVAGHGGLAETVTDGKTGLLFKPCDADDLQKKVEYLLDHREIIPALLKNGAEYVRRCHDPAAQSAAVVEIYEKLLHRK